MSAPRRLRARRGAIRKAAQLEGLRRLTDGEAADLLSESVNKTVNELIAWTPSGCRTGEGSEVRMRATVFNSLNEPLYFGARIELDRPLVSHWMLTWGTRGGGQQSVGLRRLDLRDFHRNPDGERWEKQTHKHRWSEADGTAWAYTPDDIPHEERPDFVGPDDYRSISEAFLAECGVGLGPDYRWSEPPLGGGSLTLWTPP